MPQQVNALIVGTIVMNVLDALLRTNFASIVKKGAFFQSLPVSIRQMQK